MARLKEDDRVFSTRESGCGSVMVWGAFGGAETRMLAILEGKQTAKSTYFTLKNYIIPFVDEQGGNGLSFQQDNASATHFSVYEGVVCGPKNFPVINWTANSPT